MTTKRERTRRQQSATVLKLANQLRFELLLLHRMEPQAAGLHAAEAREPTLAEVYAAAVLRAAGRDLSP
ncbi:hypothetical protein [Aureimonas sp. AU4]|uniref:hypothetical protein n=1 Tax=Aureimonas sp. AU4 TaxID=1638163 RepID=UPI0007807A90|nr:hypothetical protein [Aureimonas sp. AU4]